MLVGVTIVGQLLCSRRSIIGRSSPVATEIIVVLIVVMLMLSVLVVNYFTRMMSFLQIDPEASDINQQTQNGYGEKFQLEVGRN